MARRPRDPETYTRFVGVLKVALPLIAIGLLSTVFLVQREDTFEGGLVFTKVDIATLGDGLTISNPRFSGITRGGDTFSLTAVRAIPDSSIPTRIEMTDISADLSYEQGRTVELTAAHGLAHVKAQVLELDGGIHAESSDAYTIETDGGVFQMTDGTFESSGPVVLTGPTGNLEAGKMRVTPGNDSQNHVFWFENGVKLTFQPATDKK